MMKMVGEEVGVMKGFYSLLFLTCFSLPSSILIHSAFSQEAKAITNLDEKVSNFLEHNRTKWVDMNVSEVDGKVLYDLIIKNKYKKALEIGTSTGHSAIWIAWALSKTGGKLITIEINEYRYKTALANFEEAGLSDYIDARLADAHELVEELEGPFDFVFSDADKEWYKNYFIALAPKLEAGGCFAAHNVSRRHWSGIGEFLDYVEGLPNFETAINSSSSEGISISCKKAEK
jgi:predicted O-methyltransferase YrrM